MTVLIKTLLVAHVMFGVIGTMAVYAAWMVLLKKGPSLKILKTASLISFLSFLLSWFSGGYYYVAYYSEVMRPKILAGKYPWADEIVAEGRVYVFLFLLIGALSFLIAVWKADERIITDDVLRKRMVFFAGSITVVSMLVVLAGIVILGAVR